MFREFHEDREKVKFIDGTRRFYYKSIGYCNYSAHKGHITSGQLREHNCIEKKCNYLDLRKDKYFVFQEKKRINTKEKIKDIKKSLKETERFIFSEAAKRFPEHKFLLCRHLYDQVYLLVALNSEENIHENCFSDIGYKVILRFISDQQVKNIAHTYTTLLSNDIMEKVRQYKMI